MNMIYGIVKKITKQTLSTLQTGVPQQCFQSFVIHSPLATWLTQEHEAKHWAALPAKKHLLPEHSTQDALNVICALVWKLR